MSLYAIISYRQEQSEDEDGWETCSSSSSSGDKASVPPNTEHKFILHTPRWSRLSWAKQHVSITSHGGLGLQNSPQRTSRNSLAVSQLAKLKRLKTKWLKMREMQAEWESFEWESYDSSSSPISRGRRLSSISSSNKSEITNFGVYHLFGRAGQNVFYYQPLEDPKTHIRLLKLHEDEGKLSGELLHVQIDHAPPYEALSYTWGTNIQDRFF